jgi:hypothetical protein
MSYINRWIAATGIVMSLFMGACATSPPRATLVQTRGTERQYSIPDFGILNLSVPPSWDEVIAPERRDSDFAFRVFFMTPANILVHISIFTEASSKVPGLDPEETIRVLVTKRSKNLRARAVEKDIAMLDLPCTGGKGYYFSMTDAADNQYKTEGMCPVGGRLLLFVVNTKSKDSDVVDRVLHAVRTAERVVSEKVK